MKLVHAPPPPHKKLSVETDPKSKSVFLKRLMTVGIIRVICCNKRGLLYGALYTSPMHKMEQAISCTLSWRWFNTALETLNAYKKKKKTQVNNNQKLEKVIFYSF